MTPGTVVSVVNSYAATSEYTPARLLRRVDFPTDGKPTNPIRASPVFATSKPTNKEAKFKTKKKKKGLKMDSFYLLSFWIVSDRSISFNIVLVRPVSFPDKGI